ncbi:hypothetical protein AB0H43_03495 [Hamadaea sp. NPDC050747]|uniref:hypothetical protein n=1 Tax=Hamadaea sp. NPDC050747 TaxID=3155789 RepID=UPI0033E7D5B5
MSVASLPNCLSFAVTAPSIHNTQPWRFDLRGDVIDVYADRNRRIAGDSRGRQLTISVGAALLNLRVALLARGQRPITRLCPDEDRPDLLARIVVVGRTRAPYGARRLAGMTGRPGRHIVQPDGPVPQSMLDELRDDARAEGCELTVYRQPLPDVIRGFRPAGISPSRWPAVFTAEPTTVVLSTADDDTTAWLLAGQAWERVRLRAAAAGVQSVLMTEPLEHPALRRYIGYGEPGRTAQAIVRLGYGRPAPPAPRRALADVVTVTRNSSGPSAHARGPATLNGAASRS